MNELKVLHRDAMARVDLALSAKSQGEAELALAYFREAYELESKAAFSLVGDLQNEPTRSVLMRSAATIALDSNLTAEAERLVCLALSGNPPLEIAEELRDLWEQVIFQRHLDLRGISLHEDEIQMSIAGKAVGFGIAPANAFVDRVEKTETLLFRTAERKRNRPFRESGRYGKQIEESLELYVSVPRAASFAVTFKVGRSGQLSLPGASLAEEVIDEFIDCLNLYTEGNEDKLKEKIEQADYFRNFIGLARGIAPDGKNVNLVGFTTLRHGEIRRVALRPERSDVQSEVPVMLAPPRKIGAATPAKVQVTGMLKMADSRKEGKDQIQLIDQNGLQHTVTVPPGMMNDIVRPLWDTLVTVTGVQHGSKVTLEDIRPANPSK
jgi:hypothetical protein